MVKKLNPSFVAYFAAYLKQLLSIKKNGGVITAADFQDKVTEAANKYLSENYGIDAGGVRSAIAQSTPEAECANAIKARVHHGIGDDARISYYKTQTEIGNSIIDDLPQAKTVHKEVTDWTSKTNMLLFDANAGKMRQQTVNFTPDRAAYCGKCWICNTDVMSYSGKSTQEHRTKSDSTTTEFLDGTTPCGDCEHVSAIMASYIAGMLKSGGFAKFYWASYYVACVECNRRKSNYIGVKLHSTKGWEVDINGVNAIVDAIFPVNDLDQHASEYNPIRNALTEKYNSMSPEQKYEHRAKVYKNIETGTQTWCQAANEQMAKSKASSKMAFNVSRIIVAITGHLDVITNKLQKKAKIIKTVTKPASTGKNTGKVVKSSQPKVGSKVSKSRGNKGGAPTKGDDDILVWEDLNENDTAHADETLDEDKEDAKQLDTLIYEFKNWFYQTTYGNELLNEYNSDPDTFEMLMTRLSHSMEEILISLHDIKLVDVSASSAETTALRYPATQSNSGTGLETQFVTNEEAGMLTPKGKDHEESGTTESGKTISVITPGTNEFGTKRPRSQSPSTVDSSQSLSQDLSSDTDEQERKSTKTEETTPGLRVVGPVEGTQSQGFGEERGGSRLNKRHSKNRTKRISYIKHKQTRKNLHSRKTK
jgi:hypothetical protein